MCQESGKEENKVTVPQMIFFLSVYLPLSLPPSSLFLSSLSLSSLSVSPRFSLPHFSLSLPPLSFPLSFSLSPPTSLSFPSPSLSFSLSPPKLLYISLPLCLFIFFFPPFPPSQVDGIYSASYTSFHHFLVSPLC